MRARPHDLFRAEQTQHPQLRETAKRGIIRRNSVKPFKCLITVCVPADQQWKQDIDVRQKFHGNRSPARPSNSAISSFVNTGILLPLRIATGALVIRRTDGEKQIVDGFIISRSPSLTISFIPRFSCAALILACRYNSSGISNVVFMRQQITKFMGLRQACAGGMRDSEIELPRTHGAMSLPFESVCICVNLPLICVNLRILRLHDAIWKERGKFFNVRRREVGRVKFPFVHVGGGFCRFIPCERD